MKIELDLPQVPEGWRCIGYQIPKNSQGILDNCNDFCIFESEGLKIIDRYFLTFEPIEPVDVELEEAKKKFPVGSWFTSDGFDRQAYTVKAVERRYLNIITLVTYYGPHHFPAVNCIPLSIPTWRCCESDKPKKYGHYYTRVKDCHEEKQAHLYNEFGWPFHGPEYAEWLDEGDA